MNEFVAKKLGEVLAFSRIGTEILRKGRTALSEVFADEYAEIVNTFQAQAEDIESIADEKGVRDITLPKADKTTEKLRNMMELYIGDEWDNPAEVLEWMGFFEGAAIVHWALIEGAAEVIHNQQLTDLALGGRLAHEELLENVRLTLSNIGHKKASA